MNVAEIRQVGEGIHEYLDEFADCFGRCDTRAHLEVYVQGQTSDLQRKSVEPMALRAGMKPRSLQTYLSILSWNEQRMVDRLQQIVVRDHADPWAIGTVDETGCRKKGHDTAGVKRQWCGNSGKIDNCVTSVHIGYAVRGFHCLLDSNLYLPQEWADDPERRKKAHIPEEVVFRTKPQIALDQVRRALGNGIRVAAWTFDEAYGQSYDFLDGLDALGQTYVAEVPCHFHGWVIYPKLLHRATPQQRRGKGRRGKFPRLAKTAAATSEVRDLLRYSPAFRNQEWTPFHIKNGEAGPMVREVKAVHFYMKRDDLPTRAHWLIVARNPQQPDEVKFFVSNAAPGAPLEWLVYVGYSRWPIEQCFKEDKQELGFAHFEVRGWKSIHRHMYLTQVSHLYLNKMRQELVAQELAEEQDGFFSLPGARRQPSAIPGGQSHALPGARRVVRLA